jgi:hypothetical protein
MMRMMVIDDDDDDDELEPTSRHCLPVGFAYSSNRSDHGYK